MWLTMCHGRRASPAYDDYLNSQPVSFCAERSKLADFAANSAIVGDETDFGALSFGGFDGQAA